MAERDPFDFSGQVVWITGAGRGIGLACAQAFQSRGARVVGIDIFGAGAAPSPNPVQDADTITAVTLDVADAHAVAVTARELAASGLSPHVLVNNAGITRDAMLWKLSIEDWQQVLDVNLSGAFHLIREAFPLMRDRGGSVVNIVSINGERGKVGQAAYSAAKAGLIGLTRTAAREGGRFGIRVNAVSPGMIETEMSAAAPEQARLKAQEESVLGRIGTPQDVAGAILFLASPLASHVTGQVLRVDGGQYI